MQSNSRTVGRLCALSVAVGSILAAASAHAQEDDTNGAQSDRQPVEEVVAVGRFLSAAESLTAERLEVPFSADFLGSDAISRAGDPDIASALRRVPGLTLVDGKFVYVRGLGERYSSVLVNGASVPSPDLTRSVIPLDLFPASIVESIKIQKSPSPDVPAAFGGGVIDVRTNSVPMDVVAEITVDVGTNDISDGGGVTFPMNASPAMSPAILAALDTYQGDIGVSSILTSLRRDNPLASQTDAAVIHDGLIQSLNTDIGISSESLDPDLGGKLALGNSWYLGDDWRFGVLLNGSYSEKYRNEDQFREGAVSPATTFRDIDRTTYEERTLGSFSMGLSFREEHTIEINSYEIINDEAVTSISRGFNSNYQISELRQQILYSTRLEERELQMDQISGEHAFLNTPGITRLLEVWNLENLEASWFYSESEATTDIPNESFFQGFELLDEGSGPQLLATGNLGRFSTLDLDDDQESWGGRVDLPLMLDRMDLTLTGGWWGTKKARDYREYNVNLGTRSGFDQATVLGTPGDLVSSGLLDASNFEITMGSQFGTESYVAAQAVDAGYGMLDMEWDRWRFTVGARWEAYKQAVLPVDLLDYTGASLATLQNQLEQPDQRYAIQEDDAYSSVALAHNGSGWFGADDYQLRFSYGETIVRPDLREVAPVTYLDPELDIRVQGEPNLETSPIDNIEIRSEFFYRSGDNFTISLFYKDIQAPIEQIRRAGSDDDQVLSFANADSGEVYGIELEGLKKLPAGMFLSGNVTLSDSEIVFGTGIPGVSLTNLERRLTGHSEWVVNTTLGYDSPNGRHSAYLNYNAFGERIFFAGTDSNGDAFEQPFHSLGVVYKYFPTNNLEIEMQLDNILDQQREFEQLGSTGNLARLLYQDVGVSYGVGVRWAF